LLRVMSTIDRKLACLDDTIDRADFDALRLVEVPFTFHTRFRVDDVYFFAFRDRVRRAFRFTCSARDAFFVDHECHVVASLWVWWSGNTAVSCTDWTFAPPRARYTSIISCSLRLSTSSSSLLFLSIRSWTLSNPWRDSSSEISPSFSPFFS